MKKKILILGPVLPDAAEIEEIAKTLSFLHNDYLIDFIDPLSIQEEVTNEIYYRLWEQELSKHLNHYDAFFGFSFGGVILAQSIHLFTDLNKAIVLFSTPSFADKALAKKLGTVIQLCKEKKLIEALNFLYDSVFHPHKAPHQFSEVANEELASSRLIFGLQRVLATDSRSLLNETKVDHLHLIGECSDLVNQANVIAPKTGQLAVVPVSGMRMLQDNPSFCQELILKRLRGLALD